MGDLVSRYGAERPLRRRIGLLAAVVLAAVGLGWVTWVTVVHSTPQAHSDLVRFEVTGEHAAKATVVVVRRDAGVEADCLLRASAEDHSVVGELNFTVGTTSPTTATLTKRIRTERRATAVELVGCTADGQDSRR